MVFVFIGNLNAQQDAHYTQFMFNKLAFNPAYAGSAKGICLTGLYRNQWIEFEGHPVTQVLSMHTSLKDDRVGLGAAFVRDRLGPSTSVKVQLNYAYRIPFKKGDLAIGLMGTIRNYKLDFSKEAFNDMNDLLVDAPEGNQVKVNVGAGAYYENKKFYAGLSIPHLIKNDISLLPKEFSTTIIESKEETHAFLMAGFLLRLTDKIKLKPAGLLKYYQYAPLDFDIHAGVLFDQKILAGLTYRLGGTSIDNIGESLDLIVQLYLNDELAIGGAYDFTLSELQEYNSGSFEILLQYCKIRDRERITNPRFF